MKSKTVKLTEPIGRREAADKGFKRYYTGVPCAQGHVEERFVTSGACVECAHPRPRLHHTDPGLRMKRYEFQGPDPVKAITPAHAEELRRLVESWLTYQLIQWGYLGPDEQVRLKALDSVNATAAARVAQTATLAKVQRKEGEIWVPDPKTLHRPRVPE